MQKRVARTVHTAGLSVLALVLGGCGSTPPSSPPTSKTAESAQPSAAPAPTAPPLPPVTNRKANPAGKVLVLEYHKIALKEARWDRSVDRFRADLGRLYKMGFRPVTASEYLGNQMKLAPGASPLVITFDDSDPTQIRILPDGKLDPNSAVGIWAEFAEKHPDFPVKATFFVLPNLWGQPKLVKEKVRILQEAGSEIASHTLTHPKLSHLTDEKVKQEFAGAIDKLRELGHAGGVSLALPYGISPKNKSLVKSFDYKGKPYSMTGAFLVGAEPAPAPTDPKFNPYRVPRVQGIEGEAGITYWLDQIEKGRVAVYVAGQ